MGTAMLLSVLDSRLCFPLWCLPLVLPSLPPLVPGQMSTVAPYPRQGPQGIIPESPELLGPSMSQALMLFRVIALPNNLCFLSMSFASIF